MTTYTTVADSEIDPESPGTTTLFTKLRDNPIAITEKASGAPVLANDYVVNAMIATDAVNADSIAAGTVGTSEIAANAVTTTELAAGSVTATEIVDGQVGSAEIAAGAVTSSEIAASAITRTEIKATTGEVSTSSSTQVNLTLPGGSWGFFPAVKADSGIDATIATSAVAVGTSYVANIAMGTDGSGTAYAQQLYIQASPPYDLGDGEIPMFIFAIIDNATGKAESIYSAPEAPWHYNGKTDITGKLIKNGKKYQLRKDMSKIPFTLAEAKQDIVKLKEYNAAFNAAENIEIEITQSIKNADMGDIPHPFLSNNLTGKTVVMLDPVCDLIHKLTEMNLHDEFSINDLLHSGIISIGNTPLVRSAPQGMHVSSFKWKNTL